MNDESFMKQALQLARLTIGQTRPNPSVACIVVKDGAIVGTGTHLCAGGPHAEVIALNQAGKNATGATAYVTLEPCCHQGKTPPCTDLLIESGVSRVVIATKDDNPKVSGLGIKKLEESGIEVTPGICEQEARSINEAFLFSQRNKRPRVTLKAAISLDGKIATHTGNSRWISGPESRKDSHELRHRIDAILVGIGTVLADNPELTARACENGMQPLRIVLDSALRIPEDAKILNDKAQTLIFTGEKANDEKISRLKSRNVQVIKLNGPIAIKEILRHLGGMEIHSLLVEGGATIHGSFLESGLFEEVLIYQAPIIIGGAAAPSAFGGIGAAKIDDAPHFEIKSIERLGADMKIRATKMEKKPCSPA